MDGNVVRTLEREAPVATKDRILDAAESLFMEHGFEATSLRSITAAAGVNLAAVNYHFGSKEELFQAVLTRRLDPMNQERARPAVGARTGCRAGTRCPASRSSPRCSSRRCSLARDPRARRQGLPAPAGPRVRRPGAVHPPVPVGAVRGDDRALQGGVRARAAGAAAEGAVVAAAFHHGRAFVHARRHRRAQADRRAHVRPTPATTRCCCAGSRRSCSPG